jgi:hypothetical protein
MVKRLQEIFGDDKVIAWPYTELNIGNALGLSGVNLRADAFVRIARDQGVVIEWQSEIHTQEGCDSDWFCYDDIAGRDDLKKKMCAKAGLGYLELWSLDLTDSQLRHRVLDAASKSSMIDEVIEYIDSKKTYGRFSNRNTKKKSNPFPKSERKMISRNTKWAKRKFGQ